MRDLRSDNDRAGARQAATCRAHACLRSLSLIAATATGLGCQTYEASPLMPEAHRAAWHARTLDAAGVAGFVDRLAGQPGERGEVEARFDLADGLSLDEGLVVALVYNPSLRLERLEAGVAAATADNAGLWADPQLQFSVLRITESVPDPWVVTPALGFSLPISGRLGVERDLADASLRAAELGVAEAEWAVWFQVRRAWVDWSAARQRVEETERLVDAVVPLVDTAAQLARAGELTRPEAALFEIERAQRTNQLRRLRGEAEASEQRLRTLLGLSPEAPVELAPEIPVDLAAAAIAAGIERSREGLSAGGAPPIADSNITLARLASEYDAAEEQLRLEVRRQMPDLVLGPMYETDAGRPSVGLFGSIPIPLWNANRQAIAEARARRELARAAFETRYETTVGRWAQVQALADSLAAQRTDLLEAVVPLVDGQLADALRLLQLGEARSLVLLESLSRAYATKLELIEARSGEARARAELEFLIGPPASWRAPQREDEP